MMWQLVGVAISLALVILMVPLAMGVISLITLAVLAVLAKRTGGLERPQAPEPALIVLMFRSVFRGLRRPFRSGDRAARDAAWAASAPDDPGATREVRGRRDAFPITLSVPEARRPEEPDPEEPGDDAKAGGRAEGETRPATG
ncbi:hypothetical protein, partial [Spongiactinospora gelatinilytica]|uniref:hypothetical protein n=1 Tax=Spongiactinospora gelatinilytica TaxID=2666298 RepID=UPI0011B94B16